MLRKPLALFLESFGTLLEGLAILFLGVPSEFLAMSFAKDGGSVELGRCMVPITSLALLNSPYSGIPRRLKGPVSSSFQ